MYKPVSVDYLRLSKQLAYSIHLQWFGTTNQTLLSRASYASYCAVSSMVPLGTSFVSDGSQRAADDGDCRGSSTGMEIAPASRSIFASSPDSCRRCISGSPPMYRPSMNSRGTCTVTRNALRHVPSFANLLQCRPDEGLWGLS